MHKRRTASALLAISLVVVACSKKDEAGEKGEANGESTAKKGDACAAPAKVVADGKPFEIKKALAVFAPNYKVTLVTGFNYEGADCESALKGSFSLPEGGETIRVSDSTTDSVGIGGYTQAGGDVRVEVKKGHGKVGDPVEVCVNKVTFQPNTGPHKGKDVTFSGKFTAEFCGQLAQ